MDVVDEAKQDMDDDTSLSVRAGATRRQLLEVLDQRRSGLARAVSLKSQLESKAFELSDAAAAEDAEATSRVQALASGTSRVNVRCEALQNNLANTRSEREALQRRKAHLSQLLAARRGSLSCTVDDRLISDAPKAQAYDGEQDPCSASFDVLTQVQADLHACDAERRELAEALRKQAVSVETSCVEASSLVEPLTYKDEVVKEALMAFGEGASALLETAFVGPLCQKLSNQEARLAQLCESALRLGRRADGAPRESVDDQLGIPAFEKAAVADACWLLQSYAALLGDEEPGERHQAHDGTSDPAAILERFRELHVVARDWRQKMEANAKLP